MSRSQRIKTAERSTAQPWKFKITPPGMLKWEDSRAIVELIDFNDRVNEYTIKLSNTPGTSYITEYQGNLLQTQLDDLSVSSTGTSSLVITTLPSIGASARVGLISTSTVVFAKGDFVQPENSRYPYTVIADILRGSGSTVTVPLNRALITSEGITLTGNGVVVGNSCTWKLIVTGLPTYQLVPGRNVQYTGDFELIEKII